MSAYRKEQVLAEALTPVKKDPLRVVAAALIVAFGACLIAAIQFATQTDQKTTQRDYIQYWVIGQRLIHGADPYDVSAITQLEEQAGLGSSQPRISLSPPAVLLPMLPLGLMSPRAGYTLWWLAIMGCLSVALWLLWRLNGRPDSRIHLFGYAFAPAIVCLISGQLSIFLLLGIVFFLSLLKKRPALAGATLLPCMLKPHLFLVFAFVLLLWIVARKAWRVLSGFIAALAVSCAIPLLFDAHVWQQYFSMMTSIRIMHVFIPTFGMVLRFIIDRNAVGLQFLPAVLGCVWGAWYFRAHRGDWDWMRHGPLLLLVSDVCAPYGYFTDECILLPFILAGLYHSTRLQRSILVLAAINVAALIEVFSDVNIISPWYLWSVPAWFTWYLYSTRNRISTAA